MLLGLSLYPAFGDTITVGKEAGYNFSQIQAALDFASDGDEIVVYPGTYFENIQIKGNNIILRSNDSISPPILQGVVIDGNQNGSVVTFSGSETSGCTLSGFVIMNGDAFVGGGIMGNGTGANIRGNFIIQNTAYYGGGIFGCLGVIENNVIAENSASMNGGGISTCLGTIRNNTIWNNSAEIGGGLEDCHCPIVNCIIWGNTATADPQISGSESPAYCCIQNGNTSLLGILTTDPKLKDPDNWDFHIPIDSPCVDAGCNVPDLNMDMDEELRPYMTLYWDDRGDGSCFDIGADELIQDYIGNTLYVPSQYATIQEAINAASHGDEIIVSPGNYIESIHFLSKNIFLRSTDPRHPENYIINGKNYWGPVVRFGTGVSSWCTISGFLITGGTVGVFGGLWPTGRRTATIMNNMIIYNNSSIYPSSGAMAGGIQYCDGLISDNLIANNKGKTGGGLYECNGIIMNNIIRENILYPSYLTMEWGGYDWAYGKGGGLDDCNGIIQNNLIYYNYAPVGEGGGGLFGCDGIIRNNTVIMNFSGSGLDGIRECKGEIYNCIIWDSIDNKGSVNYCCLKNARNDGIGNVYDDPRFVNYDYADVHLKPSSPCINAGRFVEDLSIDYDRNPRPYPPLNSKKEGDGSGFDIGMYEFIDAAQPYSDLPWAKIYTPEEVQGEFAVIEFDLFDRTSEPASLYVQFSLDGGASWDWASIACDADVCLNNLSTSPFGTRHSISWWASNDTGSNLYDQVKIRFFVYNSKGTGPAAISGNFTVDNVLKKPFAEVYAPDHHASAYMPIYFKLFDCTGEATTIYAVYSKDCGETWNWLTYAPGENPTQNLAASEEGVIHSLVWNAAADLGDTPCDTVKIGVYPVNTKGCSGLFSSPCFPMINPQAPWVAIYTPENTIGNAVTVYYSLFDFESVPTSIYAQFSIDDGETWDWCYEAQGGDGMVDLPASPVGILHSYKWDARGNLGCGDFSKVRVAIFPYNDQHGIGGGFWRSGAFTLETCK